MLVLFFFLRKRAEKRFKQAFGAKLSPFLSISLSRSKVKVKFFLEIFIVLLLILTIARPQSGTSTQKEKYEGLEMVFIADVSPSMLTEDVKPSRLEQMRVTLKKIVDTTGGDKIGLVALSGTSMLLSPITSDPSALQMYIESLSPENVSTRGTDFKRAFEIAAGAFERGGSSDEPDPETQSGASRVIILASDGENHEDGAIDAVKKLNEKGIRVFTLTFGTERGDKIPLRDPGGQLRGFLKDLSGKDVISATKYDFMQDLAKAGNGSSYYFDYSDKSINLLKADLESLEKGEFASREVVNYEELFQIPLIFAVFLSFIELLISKKRKSQKKWVGRFPTTV